MRNFLASSLLALSLMGCGGSTKAPSNSEGGAGSGSASSSGGTSSSGGSNASGGTSSGCDGCTGRCVGNGCDGEFTCEEDVTCEKSLTTYCGCDGVSFSASGNCPTKPWAHEGECATVSCDPAAITCQPIVPPEKCPQGEVHSVKDDCYGPCVRIDQCTCKDGVACPDPNQYVCWNYAGHCGPYTR